MNRAAQILLVVLLIGVILAVAGLLIITMSVLLLIFAGLLFAVFLNSLTRWISHHTRLSYHKSYAVVTILLVVLFAAGVVYLGSQIAAQAAALWDGLTSAAQQVGERLQDYDSFDRYLGTDGPLSRSMITASESVMGTGLRWVGWAFSGALVILFVGFYAAYDPALYRAGVVKLVPPKHRPHARTILDKLQSALGAGSSAA